MFYYLDDVGIIRSDVMSWQGVVRKGDNEVLELRDQVRDTLEELDGLVYDLSEEALKAFQVDLQKVLYKFQGTGDDLGPTLTK